MAPEGLPKHVNTVIVGGGPSSLILSYILHGHIPYYVGGHPDAVLDGKLSKNPNLLAITPDAWSHFYSSLRYSTQALPVNTLLDTLIRPNADTVVDSKTCVEWRREPERAVEHVVLTSATQAGGQWTENAVDASADIGTLSYSEMLDLPGYTYAQHYQKRYGKPAPEFGRPTRTQVADYFAAYPEAVGITDTIRTNAVVKRISRTDSAFEVRLEDGNVLSCKHLVLASGIFTLNYPPPPSLQPLSKLENPDPDLPLLVIGSGFSAADVILSQPPNRKILHVFRWKPEWRPSPLKGCHHQAYPEYATVYRMMKLAALGPSGAKSPLRVRKSNPFFNQRDWASVYEGIPNAEVCNVKIITTPAGYQAANIELYNMKTGERKQRTVSGLAYVVGRKGSLAYLDRSLLTEVIGTEAIRAGESGYWLSGRVMRNRLEGGDGDLEVAPNVFIIGSLTGDSLVRHAYGGCVWAAGRIMGIARHSANEDNGGRETEPVPASKRDASERGQGAVLEPREGRPTLDDELDHGERELGRRKEGASHDESIVQHP